MFATLAGGYSRGPNPGLPDTLGDADRRLAAGELDEAGFQAVADEFVREIITEQGIVGLSIAGEGGVRASDRVLPWIRGLDGLSTGEPTRLPDGEAATRPVVTGPIRWTHPLTVRDWEFADAASDEALVKQTILGPYTLAALAEPAPGRRRADLALMFAEALNGEVRALAAAGCPMLEVDEPFALTIGDQPAEWAAFHAAASRLLDVPADGEQPHICLGLWGGHIHPSGHAALLDLPVLSYLVDVLAGPSAWRFINAIPPERGVIVGCADRTIDAVGENEAYIWAMAWAARGGRGSSRVGCAPNGSLDAVKRHFAHRKLFRLAESVNIARMGPLEEVANALDEDPLHSKMPELRLLAEAVEAARDS